MDNPQLGTEVQPFSFLLIQLKFLTSVCLTLFLSVAQIPSLSLAASSTSKTHFAGFNEGMWGAGLLLGDPTGVRAVNFIDWKRAWSYSLGYSFSSVAQLAADYLFYGYRAQDRVLNADFFNSLIFYGGGGAMVGYGLPGADSGNNYQVALRIIGGVEYLFYGSPWSVRIEGAPELFFKGKNTVGVGLGMGITYYWFDGAAAGGDTKLHEKKERAVIDESEFEDSPKAAPPKAAPAPQRGKPAVQRPTTQKSAVEKNAVQKPGTQRPSQRLAKPKPSPNEFDEFK